jgi:diguanylate cyclase (GGDEF)-like protein
VRRHSGRPERKSSLLSNRRLDNVSSTVSDLFQKAVQNEQIMRRYQQFELKLLDHNGFEQLLDLLLRNAVDYFQLDCVELWLYDPQQTLVELLPDDYQTITNLHLCHSTAPLEKLYGSQPTVRLMSSSDGKKLPVFDGKELRSAALLPLVRQNILVGSLHFGALGHQRFTLDKSTDFIAHLASIVSVCLENSVNQERLHRLSMYDMLTKVKNRRAFHHALDSEVSRAARNGDPLSLLFVDLDHFKQVNDTYGHPMGDKVLKAVAQLMDEMLRKTDHVCRYGGEEFALVLPNCGQQRALEISERIRQQVSELIVINDDAEDEACRNVSVTLSMGICCWLPQHGLEYNAETQQGLSKEQEEAMAKDLVACSDQGVYLSKAAGRNCVKYVGLDKQLTG